MKLKDLFQSTKTLQSSSLEDIARELESQEYIESYNKDKVRFLPSVDYSDPKNFAHFGSAEKYYSDSFKRIRGSFPYDGSEKEKYDWVFESTFIDLYLYEERYPRFNGYANLGYPTWGALSGSLIGGYGKSTTNTFIKTFGGPNDSNLRGLGKQFGDANKLDSSKSRESNFKYKLEDGVTIEMWVKKPAFDTSKTEKEVLFDLWNGEASSSAQYGRLRLELTGASSGSPFLFTAISGTNGTQHQSCGQNVTTASVTDWTHISLTLKNSGSDLSANFYLNGQFNQQQTISNAALGEVTGSLISYIGALQTAPSGAATVQTGAGKFSGSIDEFRYWKSERTSKEIGRHYWTNIGGGTNTDEANTKLGVYYKFNEGITQTSSYDSAVLDYSGRVSNGSWTGYQSGARSTDSAMVLAGAAAKEYKDPVIYSTHPDYIAILGELESSGSVHDISNNASLINSVPGWILEDDDTKEGNLKNLTHMMASYYDNLFLHIKELNSLKNVYSHFQTDQIDQHNTTSTTGSVKPLPFADRLLTNVGFVAPELFADASVLEALADRSEDEHYEMKINDVKNQIYQNVYSSLVNTYKEKGTNKAFRNVLHAFGIDEDVVKINFYGNNVDFELEDRYTIRATKEKMVDFNNPDRFMGSIYQYASGTNSVSFISGSGGSFEKYIPVTLETQVVLPNKLEWDKEYGFNTSFTKSVILGMHEADGTDGTDYSIPGTDYAEMQMYSVRDQRESKRVKFHLSSSVLGVHLSSSLYDDMYMNNEWVFAFKMRNEKYPTTDLVLSSSVNSNYIVDFIGYNTDASTTIHSFHLSSSVTATNAHNFLNSSKRIYAGAKRTNFTGSLMEPSDHKIGFVRYWMSDLTNDTIQKHSYNSRNYGANSPIRSAYLMEDSINDIKVPEIDTLILNWDFETLNKSDANGQFIALDTTSGSGEQRYIKAFEDIKRKFYHGKGDFFLINDEKVIDVEYVNAARSTYPEILQGDDMIEIRTQDDLQFTRNTLPQDYYIAFEKSMAQTISEEMIKFMSSVKDFNNLIGRPVDKYRQEYKDLRNLRQLFFERVSNEPDLDKYIEYYKWLDDSLGEMLVALVPASLAHSDGINNVIENYVFSRDKYDHKFPTIEFKTPVLEGGMNTINRHLYPWKQGHAPVGATPENENCFWWLERAERDQPPLSSSDAGVVNSRVKVFQARSSVLNRSFTTAQHFDVNRGRAIHGGTNYDDNKKRDYIWSATKEVSESPATYGQFGAFPLRYVIANNDMFQSLKDCDDDRPVTEKIKRAFSAVDGFMAFHHDMSGNLSDGIFKGGMVMPFNIMSSSALSGYSELINGIPGAGENINITNLHSDTTDNTNDVPMQSPFTERWVGGHQHRHSPVNRGTDSEATRGEGYKILVNNIENSSGSIGIAGADYPYPHANQINAPFFRIDQAKARYYRDERAKRPVNIKNIQTTGSQVGNYQKNYQYVHTFGTTQNKTFFRSSDPTTNLHNTINSRLPETNLEASLVARGVGGGNVASNFNTSSLYLGGVKTSTTLTSGAIAGRSVISSRFSAPGGFETMSEIFLDKYAKEHSAYNALPFRNLQVRGLSSGENGTIRLIDIHGNRYGLLTHLTRHSAQGGVDSVLGGDNPSFHKVNRNAKWDTSEQAYDYDNYWIQHQIPQSDYQYKWVKASHTASYATSSLAGHILSDYTEPSGTSSRLPIDHINNIVINQSIINQRITGTTAYGFPSWEQIRNNDRTKNILLKKAYGYSIKNTTTSESATAEESRVTMNVPNTVDIRHEGSEFQFKYPYVNMKYHFDSLTLRNATLNEQNETLYESLYGFYSSQESEAQAFKKNIKQVIFPRYVKHTKYSTRHRHFFKSHFWAKGENTLYNPIANETGSYSRLDEEGRRETNVTASLFGANSLNRQTEYLISDGYLNNIIPSQSIWSMDSRTNFTSSSPQSAASNSAGAPGVLQNQDHHFHNGTSEFQLMQSGSVASGSFEVSGAFYVGTVASATFDVAGLPVGGERSLAIFDLAYEMMDDGHKFKLGRNGDTDYFEIDLDDSITGSNTAIPLPLVYQKAAPLTGSMIISGTITRADTSQLNEEFVFTAWTKIARGSLHTNNKKYLYYNESTAGTASTELFFDDGSTTADQGTLIFTKHHEYSASPGSWTFRWDDLASSASFSPDADGISPWQQITLVYRDMVGGEEPPFVRLYINNVWKAYTLGSSSNKGAAHSLNIANQHYVMSHPSTHEFRTGTQVDISDMQILSSGSINVAQNLGAFETKADLISNDFWQAEKFAPIAMSSSQTIAKYVFGDASGSDDARAGVNKITDVNTSTTNHLDLDQDLSGGAFTNSRFTNKKYTGVNQHTSWFDDVLTSIRGDNSNSSYFDIDYVAYTQTASADYDTSWWYPDADADGARGVYPKNDDLSGFVSSSQVINYARFYAVANLESAASNYTLAPVADNGVASGQEASFTLLENLTTGSTEINSVGGNSIEYTGISIDGTTIRINHHNNSQGGNQVNTFAATYLRCISGSATDYIKFHNDAYPATTALEPSDDISISFWWAAASATEGVLQLESATGGTSFGALSIYSTSTALFLRAYEGGTDYKYWKVNHSAIANVTDLNHYCFTFDVSNALSDSSLTLYVNGSSTSLFSTETAGFSTFSHTYTKLVIAGVDGSPHYELRGKLCEVSLWDTILDASDVSEIYHDGRIKNLNRHEKVKNLVHWYRLGQESNITALSVSDDLSTITTIPDASPRSVSVPLTVNLGSSMTVENGLPDNIITDSTFRANLTASIDSNVANFNAANTDEVFTVSYTSVGTVGNGKVLTEDSLLITNKVSPTAGGINVTGSVNNDQLDIGGINFIADTASRSSSSPNFYIDATSTDSAFWNALSASIKSNTGYDTIAISGTGTKRTLSLTSSATGSAQNKSMSAEVGTSFGNIVALTGGVNGTFRGVRFGEVIPQPRYNYPHVLQSPGSLRSPSDKSNLGLIDQDYKLRSNHYALTRSLGYSTDGLYDNTSRWTTPDLSGLTPMDDDYNVWYERIRGSNKHFSLVPEFRISSHIKDIISSGSDERNYFAKNYWLEITGASFDNGQTVARNNRGSSSEFLNEYSTTTNIKDIDQFIEDNVVDMDMLPVKLTLTCDAIKSFLPYKGFYPQTRTVQMCEAFAESYGKGIVADEANPDDTNLNFPDNNVLAQARPIFDAVMAPGLLFNTIKSGMAVDYPIVTSKMATASLKDPYGGVNHMISNEYFEDRLPFETLIKPEAYMSNKFIVDMNPHPSSSFNLKAKIGNATNPNYKLMANNFFSEVMEFFLQEGKSSKLVSKPDTDPDFGIVTARADGVIPIFKSIFRVFKSRKQHPYLEFSGAADIIANSTDTSGAFDKYHNRPPSGTNYFLKEYQGLTGSNLEYDVAKVSYPRPQINPYAEVGTITMYSQPNAFGPPCAGGVAVEYSGRDVSENALTGDNNNTTYMMYDSTNGYNAPFTPPYYDGEAWAVYTFTPLRTGKHSLDEILENTKVEFLRYELNHESGSYGDRGTFGPQGFSINDNAMQVDASFNLFKQAVFLPSINIGTNVAAGKAWIIESKFETPILDFSKYLNREYNAEFESGVSADDIYTSKLSLSGTRQEPDTLSAVHSSLSTVHELSGILNPIGMWHQHGEFPTSPDKGIFMQIMDMPLDYQRLGSEMTIPNPKYATVKPEIASCDGAGLESAYNQNARDTMYPYFKKQAIKRRLVGDDEFAVEGGAIQIVNLETDIIIDTELRYEELQSIYGYTLANTGTVAENFKLFDVFKDTSSYTVGSLTTGSDFTASSVELGIYLNGTASTDYNASSSSPFKGHWAASYYHYDRESTYAPLMVTTKNFASLGYDYGTFSKGFFEDFLRDFSIGVSYSEQSTRFSDATEVACIDSPQGTVLTPSVFKDALEKNNNNITIGNLSKINMTDSSRVALGDLIGSNRISASPSMTQEAIKVNTAISSTRAGTTKFKNTSLRKKTFRLIPDNPSVSALASSDTSSYNYPEPMFVRGAIRYNAGTSSAASGTAQRSIGYFNKMPQYAPQSDKNITANPSTVRWGQFMHGDNQGVRSLADLVGFSQDAVKMGVTAKSRTIAEALVAIPYLEKEDGTPEYLTLDNDIVNKYLKDNSIVQENRSEDDFLNVSELTDDAIKDQVNKMQKYVLPPHIDFISYDVQPLPMYIFEFKKNLDRDDLNNLWQGVRSENMKKVQFEQKQISHVLSVGSLLGGIKERDANMTSLKDIRWRIFKVKQKANFFYNNKMKKDINSLGALTQSENSEFDNQKYGYNWPYDYFSLVENVQVKVDIELVKPISELPTVIEGGSTSSPQIAGIVENVSTLPLESNIGSVISQSEILENENESSFTEMTIVQKDIDLGIATTVGLGYPGTGGGIDGDGTSNTPDIDPADLDNGTSDVQGSGGGSGYGGSGGGGVPQGNDGVDDEY